MHFKLAHSELEKAQPKGKHYYDRKSKVRKFQPGEKVLVLLPILPTITSYPHETENQGNKD